MIESCKHESIDMHTNLPIADTLSAYLKFISPAPQRAGDAAAGYDYLVYGDYISSGIPLVAYKQFVGTDLHNYLNRTGESTGLPHDYNLATAPNGVKIVGPNCLQCHAQMLNGELILGLGNALADFTTDQSGLANAANLGISLVYGAGSPEYAAFENFYRAISTIAPKVICDTRGVNPADKLALVLAAHRHRDHLTWIEEETAPVMDEVIPSDVPAWWLMKKKNSEFYTALGRGDHARISMASGLLTMQDSTEARRIDNHIPDVMAFIKTIEPPLYPENIDEEMALQGKAIFDAKCATCHGTYGEEESYPNLLVDHKIIQTDSALFKVYEEVQYFIDDYNDGWFGHAPGAASLVRERGFIAPPLDGIWATAPYLHNGSVPTLEDLLYSPQRPTYWRRSFEDDDLDYNKMGWNYSIENAPGDKTVYNTTQYGYGNRGHYFGDDLTIEQRKAVIEYLKSL